MSDVTNSDQPPVSGPALGPADGMPPAQPVPGPPPVPAGTEWVASQPPADLPPAPPGYVWAQPVPEPPRWRAPAWLKVLSVLWIVGLLIGAVYYAKHGRPTVREQTTIVSARPVVDRAIADAVTAAGTGPVIAVSDYAKTGSCRVTPVRGGSEYARTLTLATPPGTESALLKTIATGLPKSYRASADDKATTMYADAGDFVGVLGTVKTPGQVQIRAVTGCRPMGGSVPLPASAVTELPEITAAEQALGVQAGSVTRTQVACPDGGVIATETATVPTSQVPGPLRNAKLSAAPTVAADNLYAYRSTAADVLVRQSASGLTISATTRC